MGKRSDRRKFKRRRQRAGFVLLVSLAIVVYGTYMLFGADASGLRLTAFGGGEQVVDRVAAPNVDEVPKVARETASADEKAADEEQAKAESADKGDKGGGDKGGGDKAAEAKKEPEQAAKPEIPAPPTNDLWMDIPALGLNDNYIANSNSPVALDQGAAKTVESGFPWQDNANTYISAHRLGWPGTASWHQFYNLPSLGLGAKIYLYDVNGTVYTYEVTGFKEVTPQDTWVTGPQAGRDMISLMTCIENFGDYWTMGPNWYARYVVQADRVSVDPA